MILYDFNILKYLENNKYLLAINKYYRKIQGISKKQLQKDTGIPHATFRRAELNDFVDHPDLLIKMAEYFQLPTEINLDLIKELNDDFNILYTYYYLDDKEKLEFYFNKIEEKKPKLEKTVFITIYHFAKLVYYVGTKKRVEVDHIYDSLSILEEFRDDLLEVFRFLLDDYYYCYYSLIHDEEKSVGYAQKVYLEVSKYPKLLPLILYQMSLNYYFINDYANCIFYSLEALPRLVNDLNYPRALSANMNMAICFERLDNTVKCKELLNKISLYLMVENDSRLNYLTELTMANCLVTEKNYTEAIEIFKKLEKYDSVMWENYLMRLYCYYKVGNESEFKELADQLKEYYRQEKLYQGYYDLVILMDSFFVNDKKLILEKFRIAEKSFQYYRDSKIVDLMYQEMQDKKIIKKSSTKAS